MADEVLKSDHRYIKGAKVDWPADMPDDMLEDAITQAKKAMEEFNPEKEGTEVSGFTQIAEAIKTHFD